jgi:hypothetical protein
VVQRLRSATIVAVVIIGTLTWIFFLARPIPMPQVPAKDAAVGTYALQVDISQMHGIIGLNPVHSIWTGCPANPGDAAHVLGGFDGAWRLEKGGWLFQPLSAQVILVKPPPEGRMLARIVGMEGNVPYSWDIWEELVPGPEKVYPVVQAVYYCP